MVQYLVPGDKEESTGMKRRRTGVVAWWILLLHYRLRKMQNVEFDYFTCSNTRACSFFEPASFESHLSNRQKRNFHDSDIKIYFFKIYLKSDTWNAEPTDRIVCRFVITPYIYQADSSFSRPLKGITHEKPRERKNCKRRKQPDCTLRHLLRGMWPVFMKKQRTGTGAVQDYRWI